jgi:hypothetical protein
MIRILRLLLCEEEALYLGLEGMYFLRVKETSTLMGMSLFKLTKEVPLLPFCK